MSSVEEAIQELLKVLEVKRNIPYSYEGEDYINPERVIHLFLRKIAKQLGI